MVRRIFTLLLLFTLLLSACQSFNAVDCTTVRVNRDLAQSNALAELVEYEQLYIDASMLVTDIATDNPGMSLSQMQVIALTRKTFEPIPDLPSPEEWSCEKETQDGYQADTAKANQIADEIEQANVELRALLTELAPLADRNAYSVQWQEFLDAVNASMK